MKKGQMSMEIAILIIGALVCACIGGYYFSSNVADSGSTAGDSASSVCNNLNPVIMGTTENFNELLLAGNSENEEIIPLQFHLLSISDGYLKTNLSAGSNTIYIQKNTGISPNADSVYVLYDDFSSTSLNTTKWTTSGSGGLSIADGKLSLWANNNNLWRAILSKEKYENITIITKSQFQTYSDEDARTMGCIFSNGTYNGSHLYSISGGLADRDNYMFINSKDAQINSTSVNVEKLIDYDVYFKKVGNNYLINTSLGSLSVTNTQYSSEYVGVYAAEGKAVFDYIIVLNAVENDPVITNTESIDENTIKLTVESIDDIENYQLNFNPSLLNLINVEEPLLITNN